MSQIHGQVLIRSARPQPLPEVLNPFNLVADLWRYRDLLKQFSSREVAVRHKGTLLGAAWTVINPLLTLAVYTFLFTVVFPSKWGTLGTAGHTANFALNFFCGYVVYTVFADVATRAPGLVLDRPNLVRKVVFPLEILPVAATLASLAFALVGIVLLLIAVPIFSGHFSSTVWMFPVVLIPLCSLTLGVAWFLAALGVFIRDTRQVMPVIMQLYFFMTPIFYPLRDENGNVSERIPPAFSSFLELNPMTTVVEASRATLLNGKQPDWIALGWVTLVGLILMQLGYAWFMRVKRGFADVI